jgi:hypothetical protein
MTGSGIGVGPGVTAVNRVRRNLYLNPAKSINLCLFCVPFLTKIVKKFQKVIKISHKINKTDLTIIYFYTNCTLNYEGHPLPFQNIIDRTPLHEISN